MTTKANWRQIAVGMPIWYKHKINRNHSEWRAGLVVALNNRKGDTAKAQVQPNGPWIHVHELYFRKPELKGLDIPDERQMHLAKVQAQQKRELEAHEPKC